MLNCRRIQLTLCNEARIGLYISSQQSPSAQPVAPVLLVPLESLIQPLPLVVSIPLVPSEPLVYPRITSTTDTLSISHTPGRVGCVRIYGGCMVVCSNVQTWGGEECPPPPTRFCFSLWC